MAEEKKTVKRKPTALKRDLQNEARRLHNRSFRARVKTAMQTFESSSKEGAAVKENLQSVFSLLDKGVKTGKYTLNKASRLKGKFAKKAKAIRSLV